MVKHYNPSISERALRTFNTKNGEHLPAEVAPYIQAVLPLKPLGKVVGVLQSNSSGTGAVFTSLSGKDTYITGAVLTLHKDATSDSQSFRLTATIDGVSGTVFAQIYTLTTTAAEVSQFYTFDPPIKVDRATAVNASKTHTVGNAAYGAIIYGYTEEVTK